MLCRVSIKKASLNPTKFIERFCLCQFFYITWKYSSSVEMNDGKKKSNCKKFIIDSAQNVDWQTQF